MCCVPSARRRGIAAPCISLDILFSYQGIRAGDEPVSLLRLRACDVDQVSPVKFLNKLDGIQALSELK